MQQIICCWEEGSIENKLLEEQLWQLMPQASTWTKMKHTAATAYPLLHQRVAFSTKCCTTVPCDADPVQLGHMSRKPESSSSIAENKALNSSISSSATQRMMRRNSGREMLWIDCTGADAKRAFQHDDNGTFLIGGCPYVRSHDFNLQKYQTNYSNCEVHGNFTDSGLLQISFYDVSRFRNAGRVPTP